jgi:peptidoglycan hydrolase CwlO-like protein
MTLFRRVLPVLLILGCICGPALAAGATTEDDLAAARQKLEDARKQGDELAAAFTAADHKLETTQGTIAKLEDSIAATQAHADDLRAIARERAVFATRTRATSSRSSPTRATR